MNTIHESAARFRAKLWAALGMVFLVLLLPGCATGPREVSVADLNRMSYNETSTWRGTYYCGSKDGYDYICYTSSIFEDRYLKVKSSELRITPQRDYPLSREKWVDISSKVSLRGPIE